MIKNYDKVSRYFLLISILALTIVCLIVYNTSVNKYLSQINDAKSNELIKPFDPKLNQEVIKEIVQREDLSQ